MNMFDIPVNKTTRIYIFKYKFIIEIKVWVEIIYMYFVLFMHNCYKFNTRLM